MIRFSKKECRKGSKIYLLEENLKIQKMKKGNNFLLNIVIKMIEDRGSGSDLKKTLIQIRNRVVLRGWIRFVLRGWIRIWIQTRSKSDQIQNLERNLG